MAKAKKPKGHRPSCRCPFCKRAKGGTRSKAKKGAKKGAKKSASPRTKRHSEGQFLVGFRAGASDVKRALPRRKTAGRKDAYSRGYRAGALEATKTK